MLTIETLGKGYELFCQKLYQKPEYIFKYSEKSLKEAEHFLLFLIKRGLSLKSLSYSFLQRYLNFQFLYWKDLIIESFNKQMQFNFVFGKKAIVRFYERDVEFDYQLTEPSLLSLSKLQDIFSIKNSIIEDHQNIIKSYFLNTDKGLVQCLDNTTLFDSRDPSCIQCKFQKDCKSLLFTNFPLIFKNRGYDPATVIK